MKKFSKICESREISPSELFSDFLVDIVDDGRWESIYGMEFGTHYTIDLYCDYMLEEDDALVSTFKCVCEDMNIILKSINRIKDHYSLDESSINVTYEIYNNDTDPHHQSGVFIRINKKHFL